MPTPEQLHAEITSGTPGPVRALGEDLTDDSRKLDDACNEILGGLSGTRWDSGLARDHFHLRGEELYVSTSLAAWRLFRCGDLLVNVASEYEGVVDEADAQLRAWRNLTPEQRERPATEASWVHALTSIKEGWSDQLTRAAGELTDDTEGGSVDGPLWLDAGRDSDQDWAAEGASKDFFNHLANGTLRGPRIPDSYLNTGEDSVQQGLAYDPRSGSYLTTSYDVDDSRTEGSPYQQDNPKASSLTLIDRDSGQETQSVQLAGPAGQPSTQPQHSGGVTVVGDDVYVVSTEYDGGDREAGESSPRIYRYSMADIRQAEPGARVPAQARFDAPASSYISHADGTFYLGRHSDSGEGALYELSPGEMRALEAGDAPPTLDSVPTADGINGVTALPDRFVFSQNQGRGEPSQLIHQPRFGGDDVTREQGALVEETTQAGNDLASTNEAGAGAYSPLNTPWSMNAEADDLWAQTHMTIDPGGAVAGDHLLDVEPQSLRSASRTFAGVSDSIGAVKGRVSSTSLSASTMGQVDGARTMSNAIGTQADKFSDDLRDAVEGAETTFEGLRYCADGYEITDLDSFDAFEHITAGLG